MKTPEESSTSRASSDPLKLGNRDTATKSNAIEIPQISLPKGGGALKGIDEKFQVNGANGTASFQIPLPLTPGRNNFIPSLSLSYNSGSGNDLFGLGWSLDLPAIQRKTDKKLPRYRDEGDVFMFAGVEDLVPYLHFDDKDNEWEVMKAPFDQGMVCRYRPRIEGLFAKIERIEHDTQGVFWKVTTKENVATIFGQSPSHRIADPVDPSRIFKWLPEFSFDNRGNWIRFFFKKEDGANVPPVLSEKNRFDAAGKALFANMHLKRVQWGNRQAYVPNPARPFDPLLPATDDHFFELVLDYGEHDAGKPEPAENQSWLSRHDAFSDYKAGFEIRNYRLCRRVLMFHKFAELDATPCLVRSLDFAYETEQTGQELPQKSEVTYLTGVTQSGYIRLADGKYSQKSLPPMEFDYQRLRWDKTVREVAPAAMVHAPAGISGGYQFTDFYGEGIAGILSEQAEGWFFKHNLGDPDGDGRVQFAPAKPVIPKPSFLGIAGGALQLTDLEANGQKQVTVRASGLDGYFEMTPDDGWLPFRAFEKQANIDFRDPNTRLLDLNGDGQPDVVISQENVFTWYPSAGKRGYDTPELAPKPFDEERGPAIVFRDEQQSIFLADMSGDGLTDIVRIRNGEVCYWPNLGYGRFGAKVAMDDSPVFDRPDVFNPVYLQLADISGTGAADLIYLGKNKFQAFLNLSGNAWSAGEEIKPFFPLAQPNQLSVTDLLGNGTACLVWSSPLPENARMPMRYMDLMGGKKPHVMTRYVNNLGKETTVEYRSSTDYYLKDKAEGISWVTKLPFPVQCVARLTVVDLVAETRFSSEYRYRHGYYDHPEREFRGFGLVEQTDTEFFKPGAKNLPGGQTNEAELAQKPVLVKTWYHTGAFLEKEKLLRQFEQEYWHQNADFQALLASIDKSPAQEYTLPDARVEPPMDVTDADFVKNLDAEAWREALRACKGMVLRQEVFALDAPAENATAAQKIAQMTPYSVATHNCHVRVLQPRGKNPFAVFLPQESEAMSWHYERNFEDPRIAHTLNIALDELGNVLEAASVVYPRQKSDVALPQTVRDVQAETLVLYTKNSFTDDRTDPPHLHRLRVLAETQTFELTRIPFKVFAATHDPQIKGFYQIEDFQGILENSSTAEFEYHDTTAAKLATGRRLIEHIRTVFYDELLGGPLPLGQLGPLGLQFESYQLAWTPVLLTHLFGGKVDETLDLPAGKFTHSEGDANWWIRSGVTEFLDAAAGETLAAAQSRFFQPLAYRDPWGARTTVRYFGENGSILPADCYWLMLAETTDAHGNSAVVQRYNFRTLAPERIRDANRNCSEALFDELGLVKALAVLGKDDDNDGVGEADDLQGFTPHFTVAENANIQDFFQEKNYALLTASARKLLLHAAARFVYDFDRYRQSAAARQAAEAAGATQLPPLLPTVVASIHRETHHAEAVLAGLESKLQIGFEYSDGMGRVAMQKMQSEGGLAPTRDAEGFLVKNTENGLVEADFPIRWVGTGKTVLNNKGNPVKQYEPFFDCSPQYTAESELVFLGVTPVIFYDPVGRAIRTDLPNGAYSMVRFDAWQEQHFDPNDTLQLPGENGGAPMSSDWFTARDTGAYTAPFTDPLKERQAAQQSLAHANTPATVFTDTLGRPVLSREHPGFQAGTPVEFDTFVELDIEGNTRSVTDARGNRVMEYAYDMLGHRVYQKSMDAGERWMLNNIAGNPVKTWDSRGHVFSFDYDALHRPLLSRVEGGDSESSGPLNLVFNRLEYGDGPAMSTAGRAAAEDKNRIGKPIAHFDTAGNTTQEEFDFKGNLLKSHRRFALNYKQAPDWSTADPEALLETEKHENEVRYDALNRVVWSKTPDGSITVPRYNEANLLEKVSLTEPGGTPTDFVQNINYDAKGQRTDIRYGNGIRTDYRYDRDTFRLLNLETRKAGGSLLQHLFYTYDPVGNITHLEDRAIPTEFFGGSRIEPVARYTYDPLYRLTQAEGREHPVTPAFGLTDNSHDRDFMQSLSPGAAIGLRNYRQEYDYDAVGNILEMRHRVPDVAGAGWTRAYAYAPANNRLLSTQISTAALLSPYPYAYDPHGNMTGMPHLSRLDWNFLDQLQAVAQQVVNAGTPETTWYVYDSEGQRVRKVTENQAAAGATPSRKNERRYVGGIEIFRSAGSGLERTTLHVMDDTRRIAMIETRNAMDDGTEKRTVRYQLSNHLGTACLETNELAAVISYEEYHPYGTTAFQATDASVQRAAKRYRYTGKERDEESGLYYHGARYYAAWLGRWTAGDPIGVGGGINIFEYGRSCPICYSDPNGMDPKDEDSFISLLIDETSNRLNDLVEGSEIITEAIHEGSVKAGDLLVDSASAAASKLRESGHPLLATGVETYGVGLATVTATTLEVAGQTIAAGPNAVLGLKFGGENIGTGAARIKTAEDWKDKTLGGLEILAGAGAGAGVVLSVLPKGGPSRQKTPTPKPTTPKQLPSRPEPKGLLSPSSESKGYLPQKVSKSPDPRLAKRGVASPSTPPSDFVPVQEIIPVDRVARGGKAFAPKVNPSSGGYRGITPKMRAEAQRLGERWQGPGEYDVGHRIPLSQTPPGARVRLKSQAMGPNRGEGNAISRSNELRRKAGLYTR